MDKYHAKIHILVTSLVTLFLYLQMYPQTVKQEKYSISETLFLAFIFLQNFSHKNKVFFKSN